MRTLTAAVAVALLADVLHRASHAPWQCDDTCRPWQLWPERNRG